MNRQNLTHNITGAIIIVVGALLLLNSLNVVDFSYLLNHYWPLLIVAGGLIIVANSLRSWPTAAYVIALGILFQLRTLDVIHVDPWQLVWPLIIIFVGVSMIFSRVYAGKRVSKAERDDISAILAGSNISNHSKNFKQSNVTAIMGGAKMDLRKAEFDKDSLIEVFGFWGGVEIIVPKNIVIRNQISNVLAGTEDKTDQTVTAKSPVLTIAGTVIMAGVSIRNRPAED